MRFADAPSRARRRLRSGDVLLCTVRPGLQSHTRIQGEESQRIVGSTGFAVLRPHSRADSGFIFHQLFSNGVASQLRALETGSSYPAVNERDVRRLRLYTPEPRERQRIAVVLDTVDEAIGKTEAVIAKLKQSRAGLLHDLLTRGLDEHGQLRDPITHPERFQDTELGRLPKEWSVLPINAVCKEIVDCKNRTPPYTDTGYPVVRTTNVRGGELLFEDMLFTNEEGYREWTLRRKPVAGDLLITREAPVGEACLVPEDTQLCLGQRMMLFAIDRSQASPGFVMNFVLSVPMQRRFAQLAGGSTVGHVRLEEMKTFAIPAPQVEEQRAIAGILDTLQGSLRSESTLLLKLHQLRLGLMSDLLTGRVRVPEAFAVEL